MILPNFIIFSIYLELLRRAKLMVINLFEKYIVLVYLQESEYLNKLDRNTLLSWSKYEKQSYF